MLPFSLLVLQGTKGQSSGSRRLGPWRKGLFFSQECQKALPSPAVGLRVGVMMAALSGLTHSRPGRYRAPPAALLPSVRAAGLPLLVPSVSCSPVHAVDPRARRAVSRSSSLAPAPSRSRQNKMAQIPGGIYATSPAAINRQRRGGSARGRGALPAGAGARAEPRELPLPSPGAAGTRQRLNWGWGLCWCPRGYPRPTAPAQPSAAAQGSRSSLASRARDPPSSAPILTRRRMRAPSISTH